METVEAERGKLYGLVPQIGAQLIMRAVEVKPYRCAHAAAKADFG